MKKLRNYQEAALKATYDFCRAREGNPLVVLPTGAGKTLLMAKICSDTVGWSLRPIIISHSPELVKQTYDEIREVFPQLKPSIFCDKLGKKDLSGNVVISSVQSLYYNADKIGMFRVALVDECDSIPNKRTTGMYHTIIEKMKANDPRLRLIGLTATPYRLDGGLIFGPDELFSEIVYEAEIHKLIEQNHLCKVMSKAAQSEVSRRGLKVRNGDFTEESMNQVYAAEGVVRTAASELHSVMQDRRKCLVFCCSVKHCDIASRYLPDSAVLTYDTPDKERQAIIHGFKAGHIKYLVNINICSIGFNVPDVDTIALWRPTKSKRLYYQQVGRGMRIHPSKDHCLVLDFSGNAREHGPVNRLIERVMDEHVTKKPQGPAVESEELVRVCPVCREVNDRSNERCSDCGAVLKKPRAITTQESLPNYEADILDMQKRDDKHKVVVAVMASVYHKAGRPDSVKIVYEVEHGKPILEWIFPGSRGFGSWWSRHLKIPGPVPNEAAEAVDMINSGFLRFPKLIMTIKNSRGYQDIVSRKFEGEGPAVFNFSLF